MKKIVKKDKKQQVSREITINVQSIPIVPTESQLSEPMMDGKKMTLSPTWINSAQLIKIVQKTPKEFIYTRPGKGGKTWTYVTGAYIEKVLNFVFGWNWDFEVVEHGREQDQIWVKAKLTVKSPKGETITKSQFGRADIKYKKDTKVMLDFGNDLKAATTDALKKCASLLGIASDVYGKMEYKDESGVEPKPTNTSVQSKETTYVKEEFQDVILCQGCDSIITEQESEYSKKIYGKKYCRNCQQEQKKK